MLILNRFRSFSCFFCHSCLYNDEENNVLCLLVADVCKQSVVTLYYFAWYTVTSVNSSVIPTLLPENGGQP